MVIIGSTLTCGCLGMCHSPKHPTDFAHTWLHVTSFMRFSPTANDNAGMRRPGYEACYLPPCSCSGIERKLLPLSVQIFWYYRGALSSSLMWYIFVQCAFFFFQCVTTDIFAWYESTTVIRTDLIPLTRNCTFLPQCNNTNGTNGTLGLWRTYFSKNYFYSMNDTVFTEMFMIIDYGYLLTCSWLYASVYSLLLSVFVCVPVYNRTSLYIFAL